MTLAIVAILMACPALEVPYALSCAAVEFGAPLDIVAAIALAESSGNPVAQSRRGGNIIARGLMQISKRYQSSLVTRILGVHPSQFRWWVPRDSARLGCALLVQLLRRYHGDQMLAIAAYNCGPSRLESSRALPAETICVARVARAQYNEIGLELPLMIIGHQFPCTLEEVEWVEAMAEVNAIAPGWPL